MKTVTATIVNGKLNLDFSGFSGNSCLDEEVVITSFYQKLGVGTDVKSSDLKREAEANPDIDRERIGQ